MLSFEFLNALHGDCFFVRWPDNHVLLVDGGPLTVYEQSLRAVLTAGPPNAAGSAAVDAVCVSHIDQDHVSGILQLFKELARLKRDGLPPPVSVARMWFNSVDELIESTEPGLAAQVRPLLLPAVSGAAAPASYNEGRELRDRTSYLGLAGNRPFNGPLTQGRTATISGLDVQVVAPDRIALEQLWVKWKQAKQVGNATAIASSYVDRSIPNLSSIVLHLKHQGSSALLTGDARGDRVLAGLRAGGLLVGDGPLHIGLLKVPHYGSANNLEREFFEHVHADHYVISADGVKHHHPDEVTLTWLVESRAPGADFTIHLTNDIAFAISTLETLQVGRSFRVEVRPDPGTLQIDLE